MTQITTHFLQYCKEIQKYPLLSKEEEEELTKMYYKTKDKQIAKKLVLSNLRLVVKIALEYSYLKQFDILDFIQEGNKGLIRAVEKFDPFKGVRFGAYAAFWIRSFIIKFIIDNLTLGRIDIRKFYKKQKEKSKNLQEEYQVNELLDLFPREISLDEPLDFESEDTLIEFIQDPSSGPEEFYSQKELLSLLEFFASQLEGRDLIIFRERFLTEPPTPLQELAKKLNISKQRVFQIESELKEQLKKFLQYRKINAEACLTKNL